MSHPSVSIVATMTTTRSGRSMLGDLAVRSAHVGAELVIVCGSEADVTAAYGTMGRHVSIVQASSARETAELRAIGARAATGDIVYMVDDRRAADGEYVDHLLRSAAAATRRPLRVVDGADAAPAPQSWTA